MPVAELRAADYNPRRISDRALSGLASSIRRFGLVQPIIWNKQTGRVVGGHQRLKVLIEDGIVETDVVVVELPESEERALNVALNSPAIAGEFTEDLDGLLASIKLEEPVLYDELLLDELLSNALADPFEGETDPDDVPESPDEPVSEPGAIYRLGDHRLLCGDATKDEDVMRLLGGEKIDLCMTDPPYGADIQYESHDDTQDALVGLIDGFLPICRRVAKVVALTPGINNVFLYPKPSWILCWFYGAGTGRSPWGFTAWQPIMVWGKCPKLAHGEGCHPDGFQYMMSRDDADENRAINHVCPKPLSVWVRFMARLTHDESRTVYDPFVGSGTTIIAAEKLERVCYGAEISPTYCDVARRRWAEFVHGKGCDWQALTPCASEG